MPEHRFAYDNDTLRQIAEDVLTLSGKAGATACVVSVSESFGQSVTVRRGVTETIEHTRDKDLGISVYIGQKKGHASTSDFSPEAIQQTVAAARDIARFTAEDPCAGLPEVELLATVFPDLELYHPWNLQAEEAIALAQRMEEAAFAVSPQISNSEGASISTEESQFVSANTLGFMAGFPTSRHSLSCALIAGKTDHMQRDGWFDVRRDAHALKTPESIGRIAAQRALDRLGARPVKTCRVPVIFEAPVAVGLIGSLVYAASGGNLYRKTSFLTDSLGRQIMAPCVNLREDPFLLRGFASSSFDSDGVATRSRDVIQDGVLQGYFLSVYTARKLGLKTTGNAGGSHNLLLAPGNDDLNGLIKKMGRGLVVTELLGHGINYVNGDYSRGAAGFWVENGEIAHPVEEITIAGNLKEMFLDIEAIGNDVFDRGSKHCGSILIKSMKIAGA